MSATVEELPTRQQTMAEQLRELPRAFWMLNIMEMLERLAYYGVRVVIPIYIAQADEIHGLHFSQSEKGFIFMLWALVQTGVPVFSGGFADRYGFKRTIAVSIAIKVVGYLVMATQREFWPFTIGCLVLAARSTCWSTSADFSGRRWRTFSTACRGRRCSTAAR